MNPEQIILQRIAVIKESMTWRETPFHHYASVKGAGIDCVHLPAASFNEAIGAGIEVHPYSAQWHLHQTGADGDFEELYLEGLIAQGFVEISDGDPNCEPYQCVRCRAGTTHAKHFLDAKKAPADLVISKLARTFAHSGIILDWPKIIQAESSPAGAGKVLISRVDASWYFVARDWKFFSWGAWH